MTGQIQNGHLDTAMDAFEAWLRTQRITDTPRGDAIGDLLRDMGRIRAWRVTTFEELIDHVESVGIPDAVRAVKRLCRQFERERRSKASPDPAE